jgi:hypothetical protein
MQAHDLPSEMAVAHRHPRASTGVPLVTHIPGSPAAQASHWDAETAQNLCSGTPSAASQPTAMGVPNGGYLKSILNKPW